MTYNEFVCECVMRLGAVINPATGKTAIQPAACLHRAFALADTLVKQGFMSPSLETLKHKFEVYMNALNQAFDSRRSEQNRQCGTIPSISSKKRLAMIKNLYHEDRKVRDDTRHALNQYEEMLALDLSQEVLELIKSSIAPKRDFYTVADLLMPELSDEVGKLKAEKGDEELTVTGTMEHMLRFIDFGREENVEDAVDEEQELIDNVDRHKDSNCLAKQLHEEFVPTIEIEQRVRKYLWKVREAAAQA